MMQAQPSFFRTEWCCMRKCVKRCFLRGSLKLVENEGWMTPHTKDNCVMGSLEWHRQKGCFVSFFERRRHDCAAAFSGFRIRSGMTRERNSCDAGMHYYWIPDRGRGWQVVGIKWMVLMDSEVVCLCRWFIYWIPACAGMTKKTQGGFFEKAKRVKSPTPLSFSRRRESRK